MNSNTGLQRKREGKSAVRRDYIIFDMMQCNAICRGVIERNECDEARRYICNLYGIEFVGDQLLFGGMVGYTHNWIYLWIEECK